MRSRWLLLLATLAACATPATAPRLLPTGPGIEAWSGGAARPAPAGALRIDDAAAWRRLAAEHAPDAGAETFALRVGWPLLVVWPGPVARDSQLRLRRDEEEAACVLTVEVSGATGIDPMAATGAASPMLLIAWPALPPHLHHVVAVLRTPTGERTLAVFSR